MIRAIMGDWLPFKVGGDEDHLVDDQGAGAGVGGTEQTCSITRPLFLVHLTLGLAVAAPLMVEDNSRARMAM
jgi:hypothetical protein